MKKGILVTVISTLMMASSGGVQAAELELYPQHNKGGRLDDGTRIATGLIICQDTHSGFHVWMNAQEAGEQSGHYIIKGQINTQHEIRVRFSGDGWSPYVGKERNGIARAGTDARAIFNILIDGGQDVASDNYIFSLRGECL